MKIEWFDNLESIETLQDAWRSFEAEVQERTLYCRYDYILSWYRCYAQTSLTDSGVPLVGVVRDGTEIVGIAPMISARSTFAKVPVKRVDCAGYNLAAGELLLRDGTAGVAEAIVDELRNKLKFDLININGLPADSEATRALTAHLDEQGVRHNKIDFHGYATADLSDGYEGYWMSFGWKFRSRNKHIAKKIKEAGDLKIDRINSTKDQAFARSMRARMIDITENSQRVRLAGLEVEHMHQPFYDEIYERFGAEDAIDVAILSVNGEDAAYMFGLLERSVYYHTMMSFRESLGKVSPGKYLLQEVFKYLPEMGYPLVMSHGSYEYKTRWASEIVPQETLCIFGRGIKASLAHRIGFQFVHRASSEETAPEDGSQ